MMGRVLFTIGLWLLVDIYFFQAFKGAISGLQLPYRRLLTIGYWLVDLAIMAVTAYLITQDKFRPGGNPLSTAILGLMFLSLIPKLIGLPFLLLEDTFRVLESGTSLVKSLFVTDSKAYYPSRRKFVGQLAVGIAAIPFAGVLYGITKGKYRYRIVRQDIFFKDLPAAFDGFTITQLSDIHSGSFDDKAEVAHGIKMANDVKSDLLVFTGDLVNQHATEVEPYLDIFGSLHAAYGKFSILGNHDYGDYGSWPSPEEKAANFEQLQAHHSTIGFKLLRNESVKIEKDGQFINLIGLENWGKGGGWTKYGDLNKSLEGIDPQSFKILLSHDPSHWEAQTITHEQHIHLTMAGHTHGMQFGVEIPWIKWSPIKYVYPQWAGLYREVDKYLYVNRGFGFLGFSQAEWVFGLRSRQ